MQIPVIMGSPGKSISTGWQEGLLLSVEPVAERVFIPALHTQEVKHLALAYPIREY